MRRTTLLLGLVLVGAALVLAACGGQTATPTAEGPAATEAPTAAPLAVPFEAGFLASGHADAAAAAFTHWDTADPKVIPGACARCHSSAGYVDFLTNGKAADVAAPAGTFACETCHNDQAMALTSVTFPSGKVVETSEEGEARCMTCHQGRESKVSVDKQITDFAVTDVDAVVAPMKDAEGKDVRFGFRNVHYFAAGATLYGSQAQMGYEYDGKLYDPKFRHVAEVDTCVACHNQHTLEVRIETCKECHTNVTSTEDLKNVRMQGSLEDYNGNGDVAEGIAAEIAGLQGTLYSAIQAYAKDVAGTGLVYDGAAYPYWFADADGDGAADQADGAGVAFSSWTARLLKAAYNYQVSVKDPGAFAHNGKYIIELVYDSIEDLSTKVQVDMAALRRDDAGHFAGNGMPFRDWDADGEVPAGCAKCHSAGGLPQFIHNAGTTYLTSTGSLLITGVVGQPPANGFMCTTCHDAAAGFPARYAVTSVPFPSGAKLTFSTEKDADGNLVPVDSNLCIECHQGRESTVSLDKYLGDKPADTVDAKISFKNVHYFAAGATLFGGDAKGAYQYAGQEYVGQNTEHPLNQCAQCHEVHQLGVKVDACKACHTTVTSEADLQSIRMSTTDYDGDGNATEGIYGEIDTIRTALYDAIKAYAKKAGTPIVYDPAAYPYFFVDKDEDGKGDVDDKGAAVRYNAWTPNLLRAAYNLQYSYKDPGAFTHNPKYVIQFLYDSLKSIGGSVAGMTRP
jgi:hypothetical protein